MVKIKWISDGDENFCFFQGSLKHKNRKNRIHGLTTNDTWFSEPTIIKKEVHDFYATKFQEQWPSRPTFTNPNFKQLSLEQSSFLEFAFTIQDIKDAVWSYGGEQASGPDGYTFKIIKAK